MGELVPFWFRLTNVFKHTCVQSIQRGMRVGQESDALFLAKMETVFHLPLGEARRMLGVRGAEDVDTSREGEIFAGRIAA